MDASGHSLLLSNDVIAQDQLGDPALPVYQDGNQQGWQVRSVKNDDGS